MNCRRRCHRSFSSRAEHRAWWRCPRPESRSRTSRSSAARALADGIPIGELNSRAVLACRGSKADASPPVSPVVRHAPSSCRTCRMTILRSSAPGSSGPRGRPGSHRAAESSPRVDRRDGGCCRGGGAAWPDGVPRAEAVRRTTRHVSRRASPTSFSSAIRRSASGAESRPCVCRRIRAGADAISISRSRAAKLLPGLSAAAAARGRHRRDGWPDRGGGGPGGRRDLCAGGARRARPRRLPVAGGLRHGACRGGRAGVHRPDRNQRGGSGHRSEAAAGLGVI